MLHPDHYRTLGIAASAGSDEIKQAYRRLARQFHPDVSSERNAEERFKEIACAYEILRDPVRRGVYDRTSRLRQEEFRTPPDWEQQFSDFFRDEHNAASGLDLHGLFTELGKSRRHPVARRGRDVKAIARLSLEEAARGIEMQFEIPAPPRLAGGRIDRAKRVVRVHIPKGAIHGQRLRVAGMGGPGTSGARAGDLRITIELREHPVFRAQGHDLLFDLPIAPWEAVLGTSVDVPTLEGKARLPIPPGAHSGQRLKLEGCGLPLRSGIRGDLYAVLRIVVPATPNERERALFEALAAASSFDPRTRFAGASAQVAGSVTAN